MQTTIDTRQFLVDMNNISNYALGFVEGIKVGEPKFLKSLGRTIKEYLQDFIDTTARMDPASLHHVYEWYQAGSPDARLFNIKFTVEGDLIHFSSNFTQSQTLQDGSNVPFFNKANVMESGISITVTPRNSDVLVFENDGETVFTKSPVSISNPGGVDVQGSYAEAFKLFFESNLTQSFLTSSGMINYIQTPKAFDTNFAAGKKGGKALGIKVGAKWIEEAGII